MFLFKKQKHLIRILSILLVVSLVSMSFPGVLLATESSESIGTNTTSPTTDISDLLELMRNGSTSPPIVEPQSENADEEAASSASKPVPAVPSSQPPANNSSEPSTDEASPNQDLQNSQDISDQELANTKVLQDEVAASQDKSAYPAKIKTKAGKFNIGFSKQSGKNLLQFTHGKASLAMSPLESAKATGTIKKNSILYKNIYANTDLHYTIDDDRVKEDIIINQPTDKSTYSFQLNIKNADYETEDDGTISFVEPGTTTPLFYMAKPYALDKEGNLCDSIEMELSKAGVLTLSVDPDWLQQASYPVTIDPTIYLAGSEVYQASAGFSSTQGQNNWSYEEQLSNNT